MTDLGRMCHRVVKNPLDKQARRRYTLNVKVIKADTKYPAQVGTMNG